MKKGFIITVLIFGFLIIAMVTIPFLFKSKIAQKIKEEGFVFETGNLPRICWELYKKRN